MKCKSIAAFVTRRRSRRASPRRSRALAAWGLVLVTPWASSLRGQASQGAFDLRPELTGQAVFSCRDLTLAGNVVVTSQGLETGGALGEVGHVRSNASVFLDGSVEVHGDAVAGPGGQVVLNGSALQVTGEIKSAATALDCAPVDLDALATQLAAANDNASIPTTDKGRAAVDADGAFELKGRDGVTLAAGSYVFSSFKLSGSSQVRLAGEVRVLVLGAVEIGGTSHVHLDGDPLALRLWVGGGPGAALELRSQSSVHGFLYAPEARVHLAGQSTVVGAVFGGDVDLVGGSRVRRLVDDVPPRLEISSPLPGSRVESCEVLVTGQARDGESGVSLTLNGEAVAVAADGGFEAPVSLFGEDPGLIVAAATDGFGNTTRVEVRLEIAPPSATLTVPAPGSVVGERVLTLQGTTFATTGLTVNGVAATLGEDTFTLPGFDLGADGPSTLVLQATNCGGVTESSAVLDLDTLAPVVALVSPAPGTLFGTSPIVAGGTVEDAHLASVTVNGIAATVDGSAFTVQGVVLAEGSTTLVAVATDALGRVATSAPVVVELDTTAPNVTLNRPPGACLAAEELFTLTGTFDDRAPSTGLDGTPPAVVVEVVPTGGAAATTRVATLSSDGGSWSVEGVDLGSADGLAAVTVTATDLVGNATELLVQLPVDGTLPEVSLFQGGDFVDAAPGTEPGAATPSLLFPDAVSFTGTVADGDDDIQTATMSLDGAPYATGSDIDVEGEHLLVGQHTDCAGHLGARHVLVRIDLTAPSLLATDPADGAVLGEGIASFHGTADGDLAAATVNGEAAPLGATPGSFILTPFPWREGRNDVVIELVDEAGHRSLHERHFTVRSLPLTLVILEGGQPLPAGQLYLRPVVPVLETNDPDASLTATLDGEPFVSGTEIAASGSFTLTANAVDALGRTAGATVSFRLDLEAGPRISITSPANGASVAGPTVTVTGTVEGREPQVSVNGRPGVVSAGGFTVAGVPLEPGVTNDLVAVATDGAGRRGTDVVTVVMSAGGPQVLILEPAHGTVTNRSRIDVVGSVVGGPGATTDGTVSVAGAAVELDPEGGFRARDVLLVEGPNVLQVEAVDPFDRRTLAAVTVVSDTRAPEILFLADGEALAPGASFGRAITLGVEVRDDSGQVEAPLVRLNGEVLDSTQGRTEVPVVEDGGYVVSVVAQDEAGNESRDERAFILDLAGCTVTDLEPGAGTAVRGDRVSLRGRSGTAESVKVRLADGAGGVQTFPAALADGTFLAGDLPLPVVGENVLEIVCVDASGTPRSLSHPLTRLADGAGPVVSITTPGEGALVATDTVAVTGSVSEGTVRVNGVAAALAGGVFNAAAVPLAEGPNLLGARAVDAAGQVGRDRVRVERDSQAPRIAVTSPENGTPVGVQGSGPAVVEVSGVVDLDTEPHLEGVVVTSPVGAVTAGVDPDTGVFVARDVPLDPAAGEQEIVATATDLLGQKGTVATRVLLDASGPAIVVSQPADLALFSEDSAPRIPVTGEAWAVEGGQIELNGALLDPATLDWSPAAEGDPSGRRHVAWSAEIALPQNDGPFGVIARVLDPQGRVARARRLLSRDSMAPEVVEMVPVDGTTGVDLNALLLVLFSEPVLHASLAPDAANADGLTLVRLSTGESVVGTATVAGQAVAFAPGTALVPGESYRFRAGSGITDRAGHPLAAPAQVVFHVAADVTTRAPVVDPVPAVLCTDELVITGTTTAGATVQVRDGSLRVNGFADPDGGFSVTLPVTGQGFHLLGVASLDESGVAGPEATLVVRVDCTAPAVRETRFDRDTGVLTVVLSEAPAAASVTVGLEGDAFVVRDAEDPQAVPQPAAVTVTGSTVELALDDSPVAFWRDRPVRLTVKPPLADVEGNVVATIFETVFFPGGSGGAEVAGAFLFGEVYDDAGGRPVEGVEVSLFAAGTSLPGTVAPGEEALPVAATRTDGRGRYTFANQVPAGRYVLVLEKEGYTRGVRRLPLEPGAGAVPFDSRLTPRNDAAGRLDPVAGGRVESGLLALEADGGALPGTSFLEVQLSELGGQGLPDFLPLGWTPAVAVELALVEVSEPPGGETGAPLPDGGAAGVVTGGLVLELPLAAWVDPGDDLAAVQYELATGLWRALAPPQPAPSGPGGETRLGVRPTGPGVVAVVVPDGDPATRPVLPLASGEPLQGVEPAAASPVLLAELGLDPGIIPPTGRSTARIVARSADGVTPWPSGLAVQAFLEERLVLAGGAGQLLEAPFSVDLLLYHGGLPVAELGSNTPGSVGVMTFRVSPSPRAAEVLLDVGFEDLRVFPFPEVVERGQVVGPQGGVVGTPNVELEIPQGALGEATAAQVELLSAAELATLPAVEGYDTLAAVRVDLQGRTLARAGTLRLGTPDGAPPAVEGDPRIVVAEEVNAPGDGRGAFPRLAARARRVAGPLGERIVAGPASNGLLPLEGIVREGLYLVLYAGESIGYATGFVRAANAAPQPNARVTASGLGTADLSSLGGRYSIVVPAGAARSLTALHPSLDEVGQAAVTVAPDAVVEVELTIAAVAPAILSLQPPDGALDQPVGSTVSVLFDEALDPGSVHGMTLELELATATGGGSGLLVSGDVTLSFDGVRVIFTPERPLPGGRTFLARFRGGVRDAGGTPYAGPLPVDWSFSTSRILAPGGQVDPRRFHLLLPESGVAAVFADPGALPVVPAGETPWAVTPEVEGATDPVRDTFPAAADGSFTGTVGHPPEFPVTLGDRVFVKVFDSAGNLAAHFPLGPFTSADGQSFAAPPGEAVEFRSADGLVVEVPEGAFDEPTLIRVENRPVSDFTDPLPTGLAVGGVTTVEFEGEARETLRLHVPAPADVAATAQVFVGEMAQLRLGRRFKLLSVGGVLERDGERFLSNDPALQPEPGPGAFGAAAEGGGEAGMRFAGAGQTEAPQTCADVLRQGTTRCFVQDLLTEFRARADAVWLYEAGADWGLVSGLAAPLAQGLGAQLSIFAEGLFDFFIHVPRPTDSRGGFWLLPMIADQPFSVEQRSSENGWLMAERAYDPLDGVAGITTVAPLPATGARPMIVDGRPFHFLRFAAPGANEEARIALGVDAVADENRRVKLRAVASDPLGDATTLRLFDLSPLTPDGEGDEAEAPIPGPTVSICDGVGGTWSSDSFPGSDDQLLVLSAGDLPAEAPGRFEFQFDTELATIAGIEPSKLASLRDLGPEGGCSTTALPGFPRDVPLEAFLKDNNTRLVLLAGATLPAGHRFRLELVATAFVSAADPLKALWPTAPTVFDFATRDLPGEVVGSIDDGTFPFGGVSEVRDLLQLGNLLMVASDTGKIVSIDTADVTATGRFRPHSIQNTSNAMLRSFATDGHNRLYYSGLFGSVWGIKTTRLEDAREASEPCGEQPAWAQALPCFDNVLGSVRVAYALGSTTGLTASEFLALGTLPTATPMEMEVVTQDETGRALRLGDFVATYTQESLHDLVADEAGTFTFDVPLRSTFVRGGVEPSQAPGESPATAPLRQEVCPAEEAHDRYQRVTVENLTTGQSWSLDIENPWPSADGGGGDGKTTVVGVRARRGDRLRVRYNLRALGEVALLGSGITTVDLNRYYRLPQPGQVAGSSQCGRRLGQFEGATAEIPACVAGAQGAGLAQTPALAAHAATGCNDAGCRGEGRIDLYSPLTRVGTIHSFSDVADPGGVRFQDAAACLSRVGDELAWLRDVALANDVRYVDRGFRGRLDGTVLPPEEGRETIERRGDLLFQSLGAAGIFVFDVALRRLSESHLMGHLKVDGHSAFRLQVDPNRGLLFAGGTDYTGAVPRPVIDVWDLSFVAGFPGQDRAPRPRLSLHAPWTTPHLGIDTVGTGLLYTWDAEEGPLAVPFEGPRMFLSGLYLPEDDELPTDPGQRPVPVERPTETFVPLGVPFEATSPETPATALSSGEETTSLE